MRLLFVHQNFPAQYRHIAMALAGRPGIESVALTMRQPAPQIPGMRVVSYPILRAPAAEIHPLLAEQESNILRGEAAASAALALREAGFKPDLICAHPGWGEALFLKDVFPAARLLSYVEYHYNARGSDYDFDPEFAEEGLAALERIRVKNMHNFVSLAAMDHGVSPTHWQRDTVPAEYRSKISVVHEGVDTDELVLRPDAAIHLADGTTLTRADEVITYAAWSLEPLRGYHMLMRALPRILERRPRAHVLIVGGPGVTYGAAPKDGVPYADRFFAEVSDRLDTRRVHFLGHLPLDQFRAVMSVSSVHVYLTWPFVLSWSMLEAMAMQIPVVGSATAPVQEVIRDGETGLLVDFFSAGDIAEAVIAVLSHPDRMARMAAAARADIVARYDLRRVCLPAHLALMDQVAAMRG